MKFLGSLDLLAGLTITLMIIDLSYFKLTLILSSYLILKITLSYKSIAGYLDLFIGFYMWKIYLTPSPYDLIFAAYLFQKGIISFL